MPSKNRLLMISCALLILAAGCQRDKPRQEVVLSNSDNADVVNYDSAISLYGINCISGCKYFDMQGNLLRTRKGSLCVEIGENVYAGKYGNGLFALFNQKDDTIWTIPIEAHHEVLLDGDSNIILLSREHADFKTRKNLSIEVLYTVTRQGKVVHKQSFSEIYDQLQKFLPVPIDSIVNRNKQMAAKYPYRTSTFFDTSLFHINSVQLIPVNPLEKTDSAFEHGNFLISDFLNNFVAIIGRNDFTVKWLYYQNESYMGQHAARMLHDGRIMFFVNNLHDSTGHLYSAVRIINPVSKSIVWEYSGTPAKSMQSVSQGYCQYLRNGNMLITVNNYVVNGNRYVIEVTSDKKVVWRWTPHLLQNNSPLEDFYRVERIDQ